MRLWRRPLFAIAAAFGLGAVAPAGAATITLSQTSGAPISPLLYGVNYVWDKVPADAFPDFANLVGQVAHYSIARYPGGWNAERLDWTGNAEYKQAPPSPGVDAATFLSTVPAASFITPSEQAIAHPDTMAATVQTSTQLVASYGDRVGIWEIGNEWWLQNGAKQNPDIHDRNLRNYAALLSVVVPAMKQVNPSIAIYVTADWTHPDDFATLRSLTDPTAWAMIDGLSIHTYCGLLDPGRLCSEIPGAIAQIRAATGKQDIYDSEWAAPAPQNPDDDGIRNATYTIWLLKVLAGAGVKTGAYWPPVANVPGMAMIAADYSAGYATGYAFGWMAQYYEGYALQTGGTIPSLAARDGGQTTVIIPAGTAPGQTVSLSLAGTGLRSVVSAEVMFATAPMGPPGEADRRVEIVDLPTTMKLGPDGQPEVDFTINPGTPGRGADYEIARITLN